MLIKYVSGPDMPDSEHDGCAVITGNQERETHICADPNVGFICDINGSCYPFSSKRIFLSLSSWSYPCTSVFSRAGKIYFIS